MKKISLFISLGVFAFILVSPVFAAEMGMHEPEVQGTRAKDMGMTDAQHKAIEMKAHEKYAAAVKKAEGEYATTLKDVAKSKNPAAAISAAKKKLQKAKSDADAVYKKEKDAGMKKATKPVMPIAKTVVKKSMAPRMK